MSSPPEINKGSFEDSWKPPTSSNIKNGFQSFKFSIFFIITDKLLPSITGPWNLLKYAFWEIYEWHSKRIFGCIRAEYFSILHVRCAPWIPQDYRELWSRILGSNITEYFHFHAVIHVSKTFLNLGILTFQSLLFSSGFAVFRLFHLVLFLVALIVLIYIWI